MLAYCMKCRTKREMKNLKNIIMKNKRPAVQGVCPTCGTKMFRIGIVHIVELSPTQNPQLPSNPPISQLAPQPPIPRLTQ